MDQPEPHTTLDVSWAALQARWGETSAHQAMLSACGTLDGLTELGRRYRAVLEERPGDPMALQMKAEIIKRATILGLSQLPRTRPPALLQQQLPRRWVLGGVLAVAAAVAWMLGRIILGNGR